MPEDGVAAGEAEVFEDFELVGESRLEAFEVFPVFVAPLRLGEGEAVGGDRGVDRGPAVGGEGLPGEIVGGGEL